MAIARPLGVHVTIGHAVIPPFIPTPPPSPAPILPLALLCLLFTLLAIAATIVLSLIPIYTPARGNPVNCTSAATPSTFNVEDGSLPAGQLTPNNRAALQSGLNGYLATQREFSRCTLQVNNGNVNSCPSTRRLLSKKRKRQDESSLVRHVRQANSNCASQQIAISSSLNCGCRCVGACLRRKVDRLNILLASIRLTVTFPDGTRVTVTIVGINIPITRQTTTTTAISTSTSTSTNTASTSTSTNTASTSTSTNTASTSSTSATTTIAVTASLL